MNPNDAAQLALRDIHLPGLIAWWPPAPGWWLVAALALAGLVAFALYYRNGRHRRAALRAVGKVRAALEQGAEPVECLQRVSTTLRRFAMTTADQQSVASLRAVGGVTERPDSDEVAGTDRPTLAPLSRQPLATRRIHGRRGPPVARGAVRAPRYDRAPACDRARRALRGLAQGAAAATARRVPRASARRRGGFGRASAAGGA